MTAPDATFSDVSDPLTPPATATPADDRAAAVRSVAARRTGTARRSSTRPAGRAPRPKPARKAPPKAAAAPKKAAAQTPGDTIAGWVKTGAAVWFGRSPVRASILAIKADELGPVLDGIAAEDERVARILTRVANIGKVSGAWGAAGAWAGSTGAAMVLAGGVAPPGVPGMLVAMLGGAVVEQALGVAALRIAEARAHAEGRVDEHGNVTVTPGELDAIMAELAASLRPPPPGEDQDQDPDA